VPANWREFIGFWKIITEPRIVKNFRVVVMIEQGSGPNDVTVIKINTWNKEGCTFKITITSVFFYIMRLIFCSIKYAIFDYNHALLSFCICKWFLCITNKQQIWQHTWSLCSFVNSFFLWDNLSLKIFVWYAKTEVKKPSNGSIR